MSHEEIKDADMLIQAHLKIEYLDFASVMAFQNDSLIVTIIRSSPNLKCFNISGNDIGDKVVEASEDPPPLILTFTDILDENRFISEFINHIILNSDTEFPALQTRLE
ncbi:2459_t:CDS:2 [Diversispora eburnea]|uniref:2459_t:CDS:1 n=1 Tax=Diversispora eburnea TaxID=1213867 RepID=A0A9N9FMR0_9GLOM|nr:2459_t:CDS:2 [Diversispora eburnea]